MFTGIVLTTGNVSIKGDFGSSLRLVIKCSDLDLTDVSLGDSISVSGACLTVVNVTSDKFEVDVSPETMQKTTLGLRVKRGRVNLEKAMLLNDRLDGHIVTGHVDGMGEVLEIIQDSDYIKFVIEVPENLSKYMATKGSVCLDGVSLTINKYLNNTIELMIIPHTLEITSLGDLRVKDLVNLEVDLIARYVQRLLKSD